MTYTLSERAGTGTNRLSQQYNNKLAYMEDLEAYINFSTNISSKLARKRGQMGGEQLVWAAVTRPPHGQGWRKEHSKLPTPKASSGVRPSLIEQAMYSRVRVSGHARRAGKGGKFSFMQTLKTELDFNQKQMALQFGANLALGMYNVRGVAAAAASNAANSVIALENADARVYTAALYYACGLFPHLLDPGMSLAFAQVIGDAPSQTSSAGTANEVSILSVDGSDPENPTITVDANVSALLAQGEVILPYHSRVDGTPDAALTADEDFASFNGVADIFTDADIKASVFSLSKSSVRGVLPRVLALKNGSTQAFSTGKVEFIQTEIRRQTGEAVNSQIVGVATMREVSAENRGNARYQPVISKSGYSKISTQFGDMVSPFEEENLLPEGQIVQCVDRHLGWFGTDVMDIDADVKGGNRRFRPDYDENDWNFVKSGNIFHSRPEAGGLIDDLTRGTYAATS